MLYVISIISRYIPKNKRSGPRPGLLPFAFFWRLQWNSAHARTAWIIPQIALFKPLTKLFYRLRGGIDLLFD